MVEDIKNLIRNKDINDILIFFTDLGGRLRTIHMSAKRFLGRLENGDVILGFDGSSIEGFLRIEGSDAELAIEIASAFVLPEEVLGFKTMVFIGEIISEQNQYCLRRLAKNVENFIKDFGFTKALISPEIEFFLLKKTQILWDRTSAQGREHYHVLIENVDSSMYLPRGRNAYMTTFEDCTLEYRITLKNVLEMIGIEVERTHHEVASGQIEFSLLPQNIVKMADIYQIFKFVAKKVARNMGLVASFMPKIFPDENGSGLHLHVSLWRGDRNVFYDDEVPIQLSKEALWFIGGVLKHAKALSAILAPTVNSYKRLIPGFEAPTYICWGIGNRSVLIRVPSYGHINEKTKRIEIRFPDPSINPYLAFSAIIVAGLDGIRNKIDPGQAIEEDVYEFSQEELEGRSIETLPRSLEEAIDYLAADKILKHYLGSELIDRYIQIKRREVLSYKRHISVWEYMHYLDA